MKANDIQLFITIKTLYFEQKAKTKKIFAITQFFVQLNIRQNTQKKSFKWCRFVEHSWFSDNYLKKAFPQNICLFYGISCCNLLFEIAAALARFYYVRMTHLFVAGKSDIFKRFNFTFSNAVSNFTLTAEQPQIMSGILGRVQAIAKIANTENVLEIIFAVLQIQINFRKNQKISTVLNDIKCSSFPVKISLYRFGTVKRKIRLS